MIPFEKILALSKIPLFQNLRTEDLHIVANVTKESLYQDKETLFCEGDYGDKLFIIASGSVELFKEQNGHKKKIATLEMDDFLGEVAVFDGERRAVTAVCKGDCIFLILEKDDISQLIYEYPDVAFGIIKGLCCRLREMNHTVMNNLFFHTDSYSSSWTLPQKNTHSKTPSKPMIKKVKTEKKSERQYPGPDIY